MINKKVAIFTTSLFLFAYLAHSHGIVENGFWGRVGFFPAVLSSLFTILGLKFFISGKSIESGLIFSFSVFLHPLYGLSSLCFLSFGMIKILIDRNKKIFYLREIIGILFIILTILYIAYFRIMSGADIQLNHDFSEWYIFSMLTDPADMTLLYTMKQYGYFLIPLFIAGFYSSLEEKNKTDLEILTFGSLFFFLLCLIIEIFHLVGIYIQPFSELFVASQFRRGIWIVALFSLLSISKNLYKHKNQLFENNLISIQFFFITSCYLFPSVFSVLIATILILVRFKNFMGIFISFSTILMIIIHYYFGFFELVWQIKLLSYCLIFSLIISAGFFSNLISEEDHHIRFSKLFLITICLIFSSQGIINNSFGSSLSPLISEGIFKKTSQLSMSNYFKEFVNCSLLVG